MFQKLFNIITFPTLKVAFATGFVIGFIMGAVLL